jgi:electron transfer flavoprotein beta subunit
MRVCVCVKRVPAPGARIVLTGDARAIDTRNLGFTTSPHEECAVEAAIALNEQHGGETTVLTVGSADSEEQLRYAISVGAHHAVLIDVGAVDPDPQATAAALVEAIRDLESRDGEFDALLFGNESADSGGFQVGVRVARALGRPIVNGGKTLTFVDDAFEVRRESAGGYDVFRLPRPAAVGVLEGINLPRYATLPGRLKSKKAEIATSAPQLAESRLRSVSFEVPEEQVSETVVLGTGVDAAPAVVDLLVDLGLA